VNKIREKLLNELAKKVEFSKCLDRWQGVLWNARRPFRRTI